MKVARIIFALGLYVIITISGSIIGISALPSQAIADGTGTIIPPTDSTGGVDQVAPIPDEQSSTELTLYEMVCIALDIII